ncbi:MAG: hypothetical protein H0W64_11620 [Gammaproteobacteria bacterium]|nr:hypothetical protein [Gammaproteobacteria bacterium]
MKNGVKVKNRSMPKNSIKPFSSPPKTITVAELREKDKQRSLLPNSEEVYSNRGLEMGANADYFFSAQGNRNVYINQAWLDYVARNCKIEGLSHFGLDSLEASEQHQIMLKAIADAQVFQGQKMVVSQAIAKTQGSSVEEEFILPKNLEGLSVEELKAKREGLENQRMQFIREAQYNIMKEQWSVLYGNEEGFDDFLASQNQAVAYLISLPPSFALGLDANNLIIKQPPEFIINIYRKDDVTFCEVYADTYPLVRDGDIAGSFVAPTKLLYQQRSINSANEERKIGFELISVQTTNPLMLRIYNNEQLTPKDFKPYLNAKNAFMALQKTVSETFDKFRIDNAKQDISKAPFIAALQPLVEYLKDIDQTTSKKMKTSEIKLYNEVLQKILSMISNLTAHDVGRLEWLAKEFEKKGSNYKDITTIIKSYVTSAITYHKNTVNKEITASTSPVKEQLIDLITVISAQESDLQKHGADKLFDLISMLTTVSKNLDYTSLFILLKNIRFIKENFPEHHALGDSLASLSLGVYKHLLIQAEAAMDTGDEFVAALNTIKTQVTDGTDAQIITDMSVMLFYMLKSLTTDDSEFLATLRGVEKYNPNLGQQLNNFRIAALKSRTLIKYEETTQDLTRSTDDFSKLRLQGPADDSNSNADEYEKPYITSIVTSAKTIQSQLQSLFRDDKDLTAHAVDNYTRILLALTHLLTEQTEQTYKALEKTLDNHVAPDAVKSELRAIRDNLKHLIAYSELCVTLKGESCDKLLKPGAAATVKELKRVSKESNAQLNLATEIMMEMNAHLKGERPQLKASQEGALQPKPDVSKLYSLAFQAEKIPTWKKVTAGLVIVLGSILTLGGIGLMLSPLAPAGFFVTGFGVATVITAGAMLTGGSLLGTGLATWGLLKPPALPKAAIKFGEAVQKVDFPKPKLR